VSCCQWAATLASKVTNWSRSAGSRGVSRVSAAPEMVVSVGPGRILKALMDDFHGLGPALNRLSGATTLMAAVADYRETQRTQGGL